MYSKNAVLLIFGKYNKNLPLIANTNKKIIYTLLL